MNQASSGSQAYAFNRTRNTYLATRLCIADTHWARFRGLMGRMGTSFRNGDGLWIVPSHGVHTLGMRFAIDAAYLNAQRVVVHVESNLKPWRIAAVRLHATSVLELPSRTLHDTGTLVGDEIEIGAGPEEARQL